VDVDGLEVDVDVDACELLLPPSLLQDVSVPAAKIAATANAVVIKLFFTFQFLL